MFIEAWHILLAACLLDHFYGEYPNAFHPVAWMGQLIEGYGKIFLGRARALEYAAGIALAFGLPVLCAGLAYLFLQRFAGTFVGLLFAVYFLKASFALRALVSAGTMLADKIASPALDEARHELRSLCSRDASTLDREHLVEASASSLGENLCDSVVAPLFYFCLGGVPLALAYRAVNTMDAMIGYKNHYRYLGWAAARLDDILNWIPARITALLLLAMGALMRLPVRKALRTALRDHGKTSSPNGGWPMAVEAGLLRVAFRKEGVYTLGDAERASDPAVLKEACVLTQRAGWLFLLLCLGGLAL